MTLFFFSTNFATLPRTLVPIMLALAIVERTLHALDAWVFRSMPGGHHPPEYYGVLIVLPLLLAALILSLRSSPPA
ncbi:MAG: hypothetical protein WA721_01990 [Candidatus Binataceae bacterium]